MIRISKSKLLSRIAFFSIAFPFIGPFHGSDVQPIGIFLLAVTGFIGALGGRGLSGRDLGIALISLSLVFVRLAFDVANFEVNILLSIVAAIVVPFLVKVNFYAFHDLVSVRRIALVAAIYVFVGLWQKFIDPRFLDFLTSRDNVDALVASGRGVSSLTGEPSHFGKVLLILLLLACPFILSSQRRGLLIPYAPWIVVMLATVFLSGSFYALIVQMLLLVAFAACRSIRDLTLLVVSGAVLAGIGTGFDLISSGGLRFQYVYEMLRSSPLELLDQGAFRRVLNIPISLYSVFYGYGMMGAGFASNPIFGIFDLLGGSYYFFVDGKNVGGMLEYAMRLGVFGTPILLFFTWHWCAPLVRQLLIGGRIRYAAFCFLSVFMVAVQDGSPANPLIWAVIFNFSFCSVEKNSFKYRMP